MLDSIGTKIFADGADLDQILQLASDSVVRAMRREAGWTQRVTGPYRRR